MQRRTPAVAGSFYPGSAEPCRAAIEECLADAEIAETTPPPAGFHPLGGVAPHAGWMYSGAVAGPVFRLLAEDDSIETFVVFGAVHHCMLREAAIYAHGQWETPLGGVPIDEELAAACARSGAPIAVDEDAHEGEHSIEVEVPFIRHLAPRARLLPVMVPPTPAAPRVGLAIAEAARRIGRRVCFVGSTDLTHYGPSRFHFTPHGVGAAGLRWAKEVNDRRILDLMVGLRDAEVVGEAAEHRNACGAGAIAAAISACKSAGATAGHVLRHTSSSEVLRSRGCDLDDAVGYAGVVFGTSGT